VTTSSWSSIPEGDLPGEGASSVRFTESHRTGHARTRAFVEFSGWRRTNLIYATFTPIAGRAIRSELIETATSLSFRLRPFEVDAASTEQKGHGRYFSRAKIGGRYGHDRARQDNENLYSDIFGNDLYRWGTWSGPS